MDSVRGWRCWLCWPPALPTFAANSDTLANVRDATAAYKRVVRCTVGGFTSCLPTRRASPASISLTLARWASHFVKGSLVQAGRGRRGPGHRPSSMSARTMGQLHLVGRGICRPAGRVGLGAQRTAIAVRPEVHDHRSRQPLRSANLLLTPRLDLEKTIRRARSACGNPQVTLPRPARRKRATPPTRG